MNPIRIVIADDTRLLRQLLARQLAQEADFEVIGEAADGREAVDITCRLRPDVVVMDLNMPRLNGIKATERIAASHPYIKTVMLTGLEDLASLGREAGAAAFLNKGCTAEELSTTIRQACSVRTGPGQPARTTDHQVVIERIATRGGLSEAEKQVLEHVLYTDLTIRQIATMLSEKRKKPVTDSAVKHGLDRVMTKLRIEPHTRATLLKYVLEFDEAAEARMDAALDLS